MREGLTAAAAVMARCLPGALASRAFAPAWEERLAIDAARRRHARSGSVRLVLDLRLAAGLLTTLVQTLVLAPAASGDAFGLRPDRPSRKGAHLMVLQDLQFAIRMLWKRPGLTLIAISVLAVSIGASTAIFSIVQAVLLRPLPYGEPARIVRIHETTLRGTTTVSPPNYIDWRRGNRTFEGIAAFTTGRVTLSGAASPERLAAASISANLFDVLGVRPAAGRGFVEADERDGATPGVIVGHGLWQRRFGGDPALVGRTLVIDAVPHVVLGVMPDGISFPDGLELWMPLVLTARDLRPAQRGAHYIQVVGRLKPDVTPAQGQEDIAAIEARIAEAHPSVQGYGVWVEPLLDSVVGEYRRPLWMLLGAVGFLLLIGCANISNLLLARATSRRTEIAIRTALGAGRWRIVRQLLAESYVLALAGGLAGVLLAVWASRCLEALLPADIPRFEGLVLDVRMLLVAIGVAMTSGLLFGLAPALDASRRELTGSLKDAGRAGSGASRRGVRDALVGIEVALALVLLVGAGLAIRSFDRLSRVETGFDPSGALAVDLVLPEARYPDSASIGRFYAQFVEAVAWQPGIRAAGAVSIPPLARAGYGGSFNVIGRPSAEESESMQVRAVTPGYFDTVRIPIRRGRGITAGDRDGGVQVAVLSETAARRFWPGEDPIGQRLRIHVSVGTREREREIVGIAADVRTSGLESEIRPVVYVPHPQYATEWMTVFVRPEGDPMASAAVVRSQLTALDPEVAIGTIRPATALLDSAVAQPRFRTLLLGFFAAVALALASLGLYGVMSFTVGERRGEIGLRIALGAERRDVFALVLRQGMIPVAAGLAAGVLGALLLGALMRALLFGIEPFDPLTFLVVTAVLASTAACACYLPARRAAAVDPIIALRSE